MARLKYGGAIFTKILFSQKRMQNILIWDLLDFLIHQQLSVGFFPQLTRKHLCFLLFIFFRQDWSSYLRLILDLKTFFYLPFPRIASCVRTVGTVMWCLHLMRTCYVALGWVLIQMAPRSTFLVVYNGAQPHLPAFPPTFSEVACLSRCDHRASPLYL